MPRGVLGNRPGREIPKPAYEEDLEPIVARWVHPDEPGAVKRKLAVSDACVSMVVVRRRCHAGPPGDAVADASPAGRSDRRSTTATTGWPTLVAARPSSVFAATRS